MEILHRIPTVEEYLNLRKNAGWWDTDRDATETALRNSLFSVVAIERDKVIGFGRIAGDGGLYFYIQDMIVHPDFQSKGVGTALMKELMIYLKTNTKPGACISLMAAKGLIKFYRRFEFKVRDVDAPGMYQVFK